MKMMTLKEARGAVSLKYGFPVYHSLDTEYSPNMFSCGGRADGTAGKNTSS